MLKLSFLLGVLCLLLLTACDKEPINSVVDPHEGLFGEHIGSYNKRRTYANEHGMQSDSTYPDTCMHLFIEPHNADSVFVSLNNHEQLVGIDSIGDNYVSYKGRTCIYTGYFSRCKEYTLRHHKGDSIVLHFHHSNYNYYSFSCSYYDTYIDFKYIPTE